MSTSASTVTPAYLPPRNADFQEVWPYLRDGLECIMNFMPGEEKTSFVAYTNLYTTTYNYFSSTRTMTNNFGFELYDNIDAHFAGHLKQIAQNGESLHGIDLLRYYSEQWERYTRNASYVDRIFTYLNRLWVKRTRDEKRRDTKGVEMRDVYPVYTLALMQWKQCIFIPVQQNLVNALLEIIMQDRDGVSIDQALVKTVVDSLVSLGVDNENLQKECLDVYDGFDTPFRFETMCYYRKESETFLAKNSISEYLKKAEDWLREEGDRVARYLHASTRPGLIVLCERVLVEEHAEVIRDSFQLLLDGDKYEDLRRMHALLSRVPGELEPLRKRFKAHVKQAGLLVISQVAGTDENDRAGALREFRRKNSDIVNGCFNSDARFSASLDAAYQELVNHRVTTNAPTESSEPATEHADKPTTENSDVTVAEEEEDYVVI